MTCGSTGKSSISGSSSGFGGGGDGASDRVVEVTSEVAEVDDGPTTVVEATASMVEAAVVEDPDPPAGEG